MNTSAGIRLVEFRKGNEMSSLFRADLSYFGENFTALGNTPLQATTTGLVIGINAFAEKEMAAGQDVIVVDAGQFETQGDVDRYIAFMNNQQDFAQILVQVTKLR